MVRVDLERRMHTTWKFESERSLRLSIMIWAGLQSLKISLVVEPRRWMIERRYTEMRHLEKITPEFCQWFWEDKPSRSPSCWLAVLKIFSHVPFGLNLRILEINSNGDNLYKRPCSELTKSYSPFLVSWKIMNVTGKLDRALHTSSQKGKQEHSRRFSLAKHSAWFTLLSFTRPHSWGRVYSQKIEYVVSLTSVSRWSLSLKAAT